MTSNNLERNFSRLQRCLVAVNEIERTVALPRRATRSTASRSGTIFRKRGDYCKGMAVNVETRTGLQTVIDYPVGKLIKERRGAMCYGRFVTHKLNISEVNHVKVSSKPLYKWMPFASTVFTIAVFIASTVFISTQSAVAQNSDLVTFSTQVGKFLIPRTYLITQAGFKDGLLVPLNTSFAFQIQMPDGKPVNHDYGLEGLPNIEIQDEVYPVVVNEISSESQNVTNVPERLFANTIINMGLSGVKFEFKNGAAVFQPTIHPDNWFTMYYEVLYPVGNSGRVSVLLRCSSNTSGLALPSACDGWELAEGLHLLMHIRFPRLKTTSFDQISERILQKLNEWKVP